MCAISCTVTPAVFFSVATTSISYFFHTPASRGPAPTAQRQEGESRHLLMSSSSVERAFPQGFVLTARIAGRSPGASSLSTWVRTFASSGQRLRQSGSMNVRMTGRPRSAASDTGSPRWSLSVKSGAGRAPEAHLAAGPPTGGD